MNVFARANLDALLPNYRSEAERTFADCAGTLLCPSLGEMVEVTLYEPCRWKIPGGHYTPDFMAILEDGRVVFVEVKGSKRQKNYRDARSKLRAAATTYPMFTWVEVVQDGGWQVEVLNP